MALDMNRTQSGSSIPLAETFFAGAVQSNRLAHAYVLKGKAWDEMYNLALQVARIVNCQNPPVKADTTSLSALACGECTSCRWVARNAHPAVLTISRLTYQVSDKGEDLSPDDLEKLAKKTGQPTQIKAEQIERLLHQLGLSSEATRVIIFTDAEELPAGMTSSVVPPFEWSSLEASTEKSFHIRPLERRLFNHASANRFLKTLEEPPPHTLFFFIAETEEQLLETIVSRCQVVPCQSDSPTPSGEQLLTPEVGGFLDKLMAHLGQRRDVYLLGGEFEAFFSEQAGYTTVQALDAFQAYLRQQAHQQGLDETAFIRYCAQQRAIEEARRMVEAKVNENHAMLQLLLAISQA